jgi:serine/threonine kinase 32
VRDGRGNAVELSRSHFKYICIIGKDEFGFVWKVQKKSNGRLYALKEMSKAKIVFYRSVHSVITELEILSKVRGAFMTNLRYAFQDQQYLYLVTDLLTGGLLRYNMGKKQHFSVIEGSKYSLLL